MSEPALPTPRVRKAKRPPAVGLRTGKIFTTQASASEILRAVGVRPADMKMAAKVLRAVESAGKSPKATGRASKNR
jgi:hypothetical protein